jgi:hypothetical protein
MLVCDRMMAGPLVEALMMCVWLSLESERLCLPEVLESPTTSDDRRAEMMISHYNPQLSHNLKLRAKSVQMKLGVLCGCFVSSSRLFNQLIAYR